MTHATIGQEVVRTSGEFAVGRIGTIIEIDADKNRARVEWEVSVKTWVSFKVIALTSVPYEIIEAPKKHRFPKYRRIG